MRSTIIEIWPSILSMLADTTLAMVFSETTTP